MPMYMFLLTQFKRFDSYSQLALKIPLKVNMRQKLTKKENGRSLKNLVPLTLFIKYCLDQEGYEYG